MADVELKAISKTFGRVRAVNDVSLSVPDGAFVVLVGPSGCGKTTILRLIAGLEQPDTMSNEHGGAGEILIGDRAVNHLSPAQRNIAMVFQNFALYPHMTAGENIALSLRMRGVGRAEVDRKVISIAERLEIEDLLERYPRQISGGQQQRVALGRAIVREPSVLLMDEPLSNLDAKLRVQMRAEIKQLQRNLRTTTIYVTHDQTEAMALADEIVVMNHGVVQQVGDRTSIYETPANAFVAGLIGNPGMNFFDAFAKKEQAGWVVRGPADSVFALDSRIGSMLDRSLSTGDPQVKVGIRPEHLHLSKLDKSDSPSWTFDAMLVMTEALGSETFLHFDWAGCRLIVRADPHTRLSEGTSVSLHCYQQDVRLFDGATHLKLA